MDSTPCTPNSKLFEENCNVQDTSSPFLIPPTPCMTKIGYGTGVSVYHLHRSPRLGVERSPWAVKKKDARFLRGNVTERLLKEANILKSLNHPNIVGFRGLTKTPDGREVLIMEECTQSLGDLIENFNKDHGAFSPITVCQVISCVSNGLHYLHREMKLIHGDIKSYNVLIKGQFESIKLCDFGVSIKIENDGTSKEEYIGTLPWSALEALEDGPITEKVDIFSFGLTIYEMLTLKQPHAINDDSLMEVSGVGSMLDDSEMSADERYGTRPELPELGYEYNNIVSLFRWCTEEDYKKRPSAKDLLDNLKV